MNFTIPIQKKYYGYIYVKCTDGNYTVNSHTMPVMEGCIPIDWAGTQEELTQKLKFWEHHFSTYNTEEPDYIKVYKGDSSYQLLQLNEISNKLLIRLLNKAAPDTLMITLNNPLRMELCDDLGIVSVPMLNKVVRLLEYARMIFRRAYNLYQLNPFIFGSKEWSNTISNRADYCLDDTGVAMLKPTPPIQLTKEQQKYVKNMGAIFRLAQSTLAPNRLIFGRMDEICEQLKMKPIPQWYKDYMTSLWAGEYDDGHNPK